MWSLKANQKKGEINISIVKNNGLLSEVGNAVYNLKWIIPLLCCSDSFELSGKKSEQQFFKMSPMRRKAA